MKVTSPRMKEALGLEEREGRLLVSVVVMPLLESKGRTVL